MGHKAGADFFRSKREWSVRKDALLAYYLKPYLRKIATQRRPVRLVDAFAGPGLFDDGASGSPLIICGAAQEALLTHGKVPITVECVEADPQLYRKLVANISKYKFANATPSTFLDYLPSIERFARTDSVFLYADPFTVDGLQWIAMDKLFRLVQHGHSVEVLLNLNSPSFVRRALSAMALERPIGLPSEMESDPVDGDLEPPTTIAELDAIAGGPWWQPLVAEPVGFAQKVQRFADGYCAQLRSRFNEVCMYANKALPGHQLPKYHLILGSRHSDALRLVNDGMFRARERFAQLAEPEQPTLFETRSLELVPDADELPKLVIQALRSRMPRGALIDQIARYSPGAYSISQITKAIQSGIDSGRIATSTGKKRVNDGVIIWRLVDV